MSVPDLARTATVLTNVMNMREVRTYPAREKHGALLDSEILAEVYLELIGGRQPDFALASQPAKNAVSGSGQSDDWRPRPRPEPLPPRITADEAAAHAALVAKLGAAALWTKRA